jgi:histidinol-phosphate aminotransferase
MSERTPSRPDREHPGPFAPPLLDLASGLNPYGPPAALVAAAQRAVLHAYPEPDAAALRARIGERLQLSAESVVVGAGATELLWSVARALLGPGSCVLTVEPGYPELRLAARQLGARSVQWRAVERTGHAVDIEQLAELMRLERPQLVSLCAPGCPTGRSVRFADIERLAARFPEAHFVVNQSWLALSDDHRDACAAPHDNLICVRSLSKTFAVPGARVGYLLAAPALAARIERVRPWFCVSSAAQQIALAACEADTFVAESRSKLHADRLRLAAALDALALTYTPSVAPFLLVRVARAAEVAGELRTRHGIALREAHAFGLPDHLRISAAPDAALTQLTAALPIVLAQFGLVGGRVP